MHIIRLAAWGCSKLSFCLSVAGVRHTSNTLIPLRLARASRDKSFAVESRPKLYVNAALATYFCFFLFRDEELASPS